MPPQILDYRPPPLPRRPSNWIATAMEIEGGIVVTIGIGWFLLTSVLLLFAIDSPERFLIAVSIMLVPLLLGIALLISAAMLRQATTSGVVYAAVCILLPALLIAWLIATLLHDALFHDGFTWPPLPTLVSLLLLLALPSAFLVFQTFLLIALFRHFRRQCHPR